MPYVASQPDPTTFVVELRDVVALGFADEFTADPRNPVAGRSGRSRGRRRRHDGRARAHDARPADAAARAERAQRHLRRGRSGRCHPGATAAAAAATASGPSPMIRDVRVQRRGAATAVTLLGTSRLLASSILEPQGRAAPRARQPAERRLRRPEVDQRRAGPGGPRPHRLRSKRAAHDRGQHGPVAVGALSRRDLSGRQRPDGHLRRTGSRSVQCAAEAGRDGRDPRRQRPRRLRTGRAGRASGRRRPRHRRRPRSSQPSPRSRATPATR